jgi:hypothetical protein
MRHNLLASLVVLTLLAAQSQASIAGSATRRNPNFFFDGNAHTIPLTDAGATSLTFSTTKANQRIVISYNAECGVAGLDNITYVDLDILVDGIAAPPSDSDNAFCTDHGNGIRANWVSAVTTVVITVPNPGTHTVQVRGKLQHFDEGDSWSVDDSSTVITN